MHILLNCHLCLFFVYHTYIFSLNKMVVDSEIVAYNPSSVASVRTIPFFNRFVLHLNFLAFTSVDSVTLYEGSSGRFYVTRRDGPTVPRDYFNKRFQQKTYI